jgi:hypothetical protein
MRANSKHQDVLLLYKARKKVTRLVDPRRYVIGPAANEVYYLSLSSARTMELKLEIVKITKESRAKKKKKKKRKNK